MTKSIESLITDLKAAAHEEIMLRESGDTSDKWQDEASPENVLLLIATLEMYGVLIEQYDAEVVRISNDNMRKIVEQTGMRQYIRRLDHKISDIEVKP
ncbi:hypothetical protein [Yersinia kristensenii]|uniref:hypothetical protein n=1 Tax=Yersinia kristensenii TaxID=28152 RepID=UPI0005DD6E4A|nr:hypothetical protein [Yersinia kristensenii]CNK92913.1 Uncharacterised protein [Yersinia kristensenii]